MTFKRARTDEQINVRRDEILRVCAILFDQGDLEDIHFKAISEMTSFARSTIYKYYATKEEILLDLLLEEIKNWSKEVESIRDKAVITKADFSKALTQTYVKNYRLLRLLSLLNTSLEKNSSLEKLVDFKLKFVVYLEKFYQTIKHFFPDSRDENIQMFIFTSSSLIVGLYPMSHPTDKQLAAMKEANYHQELNFDQVCEKAIYMLLAEL